MVGAGVEVPFYGAWRCLIRVRARNEEGGRRCRRAACDEGVGGEATRCGSFHVLAGMVVRGGRRQSICQPTVLWPKWG